jgi:alkaline phosphatase
MKKYFLTVTLLLTTVLCFGQQAKYIFYFIGDGMGVNQVNGTQAWRAEQQGRIGIEPLQFTQFPYCAFVTTYSATNGVTDSAAAGTALATGHKTKNGTLGLLKDLATPVATVAECAKKAGMRVGVTTTVSVDHATPGAFYAHQTYRGKYHQIGHDLIRAGFDLYAGSDFLEPRCKEDSLHPTDLYTLCRQAGYTFAHGFREATSAKARAARRLIILQSDSRNRDDNHSLPYAIDQNDSDLCLAQIVKASIEFLGRGAQQKGFFLMAEGGKIDFACHDNDAATAFHEVVDMDNAVREAYQFYRSHPKETLIVVTADHETGGIVLGTGKYELNLRALSNQRISVERYSKLLRQMRTDSGNHLTWDMVRQSLQQNFGFFDAIKLTDQQEARLKKTFDDTLVGQAGQTDQTLYANNERFATVAKQIMNETALVGWVSNSHSDGYVPVFAIGAGAEQFHGQIDNTQIPQFIAHAAGFTLP